MKTKIILLILAVALITSCSNQKNEFDDFGITAVYFPFQTPARTLILGDYPLANNENDNNHRFEIGVTLAGVYENEQSRKVGFKAAPELLENVENVMALPESYYSIETASPVEIPAGSMKGRITIQLTDAFFKDELSFASKNQTNYVVPLLITSIENVDTVLSGSPSIANPDRANVDDWDILPKDFTFYGIKFINKYHAIYLRRGVDKMETADGTEVESVYRTEYVERDELQKLTTSGERSVTLSNQVRRGSEESPGEVTLELSFDSSDKCTITSTEDSQFQVTGSGEFIEDGDEWGGEARDVIFLEYTYTDDINNETHTVNDTLVVRNRDVVFEEFNIILKEE